MSLGFLHFLQGDFDHLVMLDSDGTYHPEEIPRLVKKLAEYDVVIGNRLGGRIDVDAMTRLNYFGNHLLTWCASVLYGVETCDLCSGYWAFTRQALSNMKLNSMSFEIEAEMYTSCVKEGLSIGHVPISYSARKGEAKLGSLPDGWKIMRKLLVRRIFPTPVEDRLGDGQFAIHK